MSAPIDALILQFLAWVESETPTYAQVLDAWQSTCPRLSVWEDVQIAGLVAFDGSRARHVVLTDAGRTRLRAEAERGNAQIVHTSTHGENHERSQDRPRFEDRRGEEEKEMDLGRSRQNVGAFDGLDLRGLPGTDVDDGGNGGENRPALRPVG